MLNEVKYMTILRLNKIFSIDVNLKITKVLNHNILQVKLIAFHQLK